MKSTFLGDSASDTPSPSKPAAASGNHARCLRAEPDDAWPASGSPAESTAWCPGSCGGQSRPVTATQEKLTVMDADQSGVPDGSVLAFLQRYRHVFATLLEALSQHGDHVFMVIQKLLDQLAEASLHILILNLQSETQQKQRSSPSTSPQRFLSFPRKKNQHNARFSQNSSCQREKQSSQVLRETICVVLNFSDQDSVGINLHWKTTRLLS